MQNKEKGEWPWQQTRRRKPARVLLLGGGNSVHHARSFSVPKELAATNALEVKRCKLRLPLDSMSMKEKRELIHPRRHSLCSISISRRWQPENSENIL